MSTYYYFHCKKHQVQGGWYSRQAWGAGNADLIDTFKFCMYHALECGPENIGMHSEHDEQASWPNSNSTCDSPGEVLGDGSYRREHLEDTADIWPCSDDWIFVDRNPHRWRELWQQKEVDQLGKW